MERIRLLRAVIASTAGSSAFAPVYPHSSLTVQASTMVGRDTGLLSVRDNAASIAAMLPFTSHAPRP